jgi:hypothetical protein
MSFAPYKFRIRGGLGNQLFAYYCALFASGNFRRDVILDLAYVDRSHYKEGVSLLSFNLAENQMTIKNSVGHKSSRSRYLNRLAREAKSLTGLEKTFVFPPGLDSREHLEKFMSPTFPTRPRSLIIEGYFSDFSFFDGVSRHYQTLSLSKPSRAFHYFSDQIRNTPTLAIHHRLGDFTELESSVGILSSEFYREAIDSAFGSHIKQILIFSNDPKLSESSFRKWGMIDSRLSWIGSEELPDPAETLLLMSMADTIVCSNSTFSFWAAKLSTPDRTSIYYPETFRRDNLANILSIPRHWRPLASKWHN